MDSLLPDMRFDPKEEVKTKEGCHHDNVAADAQNVAHLVRPQEELVHQPIVKTKTFTILCTMKCVTSCFLKIFSCYQANIDQKILRNIDTCIQYYLTQK